MNRVASNLGDRREAHLPTKQPPPGPQAWLPRPHEHTRWTRRPQIPPRQGPGPPLGLIDRLRGRAAFLRLRREGVRVRFDPLWCSFVHDQATQPPKVAFALGRALGPAVTRNRLRRRVRAILRDTDVPPGLLLIGASRDACELTFAELTIVVQSLITRLSPIESPST